MKKSAWSVSAAVLAAAGLFFVTAARAGEPLRGAFALQGGTAKTDAYLVNGQVADNPLARRLDLWLTMAGKSGPIHTYDVDMTKMLHAVIISDDFRVFIHAHPQLEPGGHFLSEQTLPKTGLYHLYADGEPSGVGQQVFRFELSAGPPVPNDPQARDLSERSATCAVDGYTVTLSSLKLSTHGESMLEVHILRGGKPAADLHPYLGALAHAVFINAGDLTYVHVHPVPLGAGDDGMAGMKGMHGMSAAEMEEETSAADMGLHVSVLEPGIYKLWLQFAGGSGLHVAQFVLAAGDLR